MNTVHKNGLFKCIDAHTCGNPVRIVTAGCPNLSGSNMVEKREHFLKEFDWIRTGLMLEPRGHEIMSGSILCPSTREDCDLAILFIEVSGCLPMCGHGTIGTVTAVIERNLVKPKTPGMLKLDTPAGPILAYYTLSNKLVESVRIVNVPSFLVAAGLEVVVPELGLLEIDVAYGGNFYGIIEKQKNFRDMDKMSAADIQYLSPIIRTLMNKGHDFVHPQLPHISGLTHIMWTGEPKVRLAHARNAVFYGDKAIDRSPCGTGTSARMAQRYAKGLLSKGDTFIHESIIGSLFTGYIEEVSSVGEIEAIIPSIEGRAHIIGDNNIYIDDADPYAHGFIIK